MTQFGIDFINFAKRMYLIYGKFPVDVKAFNNKDISDEFLRLTEDYIDSDLDDLDDMFGHLFLDAMDWNFEVRFSPFFVDVVMHIPEEKYERIDTLCEIYVQKELAKDLDMRYNTNLAEQIEFIIKQEMSDDPKKWS